MAKYGEFKYGMRRYGYDPGYITDRTPDDVKKKTSKAYINAVDLNRIEASALIAKLHEYGYSANLESKMWVLPSAEIPNSSDMDRIRDNILKLMYGFYVYEHTPQMPESLKIMDVHKMNDVEQILLDLYYQIGIMEMHMRECGNYICGE